MAEETANKEKPKATLIKHRDEPNNAPVEKKKVVVVKKKKTKRIVATKKDEGSKATKEKIAVENGAKKPLSAKKSTPKKASELADKKAPAKNNLKPVLAAVNEVEKNKPSTSSSKSPSSEKESIASKTDSKSKNSTQATGEKKPASQTSHKVQKSAEQKLDSKAIPAKADKSKVNSNKENIIVDKGEKKKIKEIEASKSEKIENKPSDSKEGLPNKKATIISRSTNYADNIQSSKAFNERRKEAQEKRKAEEASGRTGGTRHFRARPGAPGTRSEHSGDRNQQGGAPGHFNRDQRGGAARGGDYRPSGAGGQRPGGYRPGGAGGAGGQRSGGYRPGGAGGQRPGGFRPGGPGGQRPGGFRPGGAGGQRPGGFRPGGYRPGGPGGQRPGGFRPGGSGGPGGQRGGQTSTSPPTAGREEGKKHHNKRFYKSKKKDYQKSKESEKNFQLTRKKDMPKTNPIPKRIDILDVITVSELARKMNLKAADLIGKLLGMGMMATINQQIDSDTATILADEYGCKVNLVSLYDETIIETEDDTHEDLETRPPIITVMGHVDHGKTKLLDAIRESNVVDGEHGGITQHIGAYKVIKNGSELVFLDTPGHAAFTLMRARGAQVTDMIILVVAANDGVMPQTIEAINHAKDAKVPLIIAVNKCDLPESNVDRVKQQLSEYELISEDWGGSTLFCEVSALKKQGINELLEVIALQTEMMELKANFNTRAEGKVIESRVEQGRGIVSTIIIQRGTLKTGDAYVAGVFSGKVRAMFNDHGQMIKEAGPSTPVEIIGLTGIPDAGAPFQVTESEKAAKQVASKRQELGKQGEAKNLKKITLDNLYDTIQDGEVQELKVIVKGDVHGSVEAIKSALEKIGSDEIRINVIHASAGAIIESDINLASASNAIVIGFHVRPTPKAQQLAEKEKVEIRKYHIIYDVIEEMKDALEGMLEPDYKEAVIGTVEIRDTFKVPKIGVIAGCYITSGYVTRNSQVHLVRDGIELFTGELSSLKRFKDDVKEVKEGFECGIGLKDYTDLKEGDTLEVFEMKAIKKKLENK